MKTLSEYKRRWAGISKGQLLWAVLFCLMFTTLGFAQDESGGPDTVLGGITRTDLNTVWILIAGILVMFMQAGFALLEAGFVRAKNSVNVLMKNLLDFSFGAIAFWAVGFGLAYGGATEGIGLFIGSDQFFLIGLEDGALTAEITYFFDMVFAATAATIVSGAVAGRTKFKAYLVYSVIITALIYPIVVRWTWGGGWVAQAFSDPGYVDFAGSTIVHSTGGWLALAGAIVLGPRIGKYQENGDSEPIPGHNIPMAALGTFILWMGWFGFNPGSTLEWTGNVGHIAATTNMAAAAGAVSAMITTWVVWENPDLSMSLNGAIGGLVSITAGCAAMSIAGAFFTGIIGGVLVVASVYFIDNVLHIDDPVGAVSAHGTCGAWGTLAVGLFSTETGLFYGGGLAQLGVQAVFVVSVFAFCMIAGLTMFKLIDVIVGFRVGREEELRGLDIDEHGMEAYPGFQTFLTE
jgi:Amt family ammonium transporter